MYSKTIPLEYFSPEMGAGRLNCPEIANDY